MLNRTARVLALAIALTGSMAGSASAADETKAWHYDVWNTTMSPFCPGRALIDCPSSQAAELRDWIVQQEQAGRPRKEVEDELYERFGDVILQAPKATGFGLAAYVIPVVGVALGALVLVIFLRRQAASAQRAPAPMAMAPDPELDRRIDEEMSRR